MVKKQLECTPGEKCLDCPASKHPGKKYNPTMSKLFCKEQRITVGKQKAGKWQWVNAEGEYNE